MVITMRAGSAAMSMLLAATALWADHPELKVTLTSYEHSGVVVDYAAYPVPSYSANWTQWGQGLVASTGKVYSAVGDHKGEDGNALLYEYDPNTKVLRAVADLQQAVAVPEGQYGFGKIHGRISEGRDGKLYFTSFYGAEGPGHLGAANYFFRYDPTSQKIEAIGKVERYGLPSSHMWPEGMLLYAEATDKLGLEARFLVFDVQAGRLKLNCAHPEFWSRDMFVDAAGNAYFNAPGGKLTKYDPVSNTVVDTPCTLPGSDIRRTAGPAPNGYLYGLTCSTHVIFRFDPKTGEIIELSRLASDTGALGLDPTGRYLYYITTGETGGGSVQLVQLDVSDAASPAGRTLCDLAAVLVQKEPLQGKSYFLGVSRSGRKVFIGFNTRNGVGFAVAHVPDDERTVFVSPQGPSHTTLHVSHVSSSKPTARVREVRQPLSPEGPPSTAVPLAFQELVTTMHNRHEFKAYLDRLALVGEVAAEAEKNLRILKWEVTEEILAEGCAREPVILMTESAEAIYSRYEPRFVSPLPTAGQDPSDLMLMKDYYSSVFSSAQEHITELGRGVAIADESRLAEAVKFCLLLPLLHVPDEDWSDQTLAVLPEWATRTATGLRAAEALALACHREHAAWLLAKASARAENEPGGPAADLVSYLCWAAEGQACMEDFTEGIRLLRLAAEAASQGDQDRREAIDLRLAEFHQEAGQDRLAAGELELFMKRFPGSDKWGKAAMDRLTCLYRAGALDGLPDEAEERLKDPRCQAYGPQIMYVAWVSCRRLGQQDRARLLQESLLRQYPMHALCADVHFAVAMEALTAGDYAKALSHLETIETQFPASKVARKAGEIKAKLQKASSEVHR